MQIRRLLFPGLLLGAALAQPARAQTILPLSLEVRGGVAIPSGDFADGAGTGWSLGGTVHYRIAPNVGVYGGYEHTRFAADSADDFEGVDAHVADEGFRVGARFGVPLAGTLTGISPWIEGGATFNVTSIHAGDGSTSIEFDSDRSVGYEVGAGLNFAVAPKISLTPGVRWRSHTANFSNLDEEGDVKVDVHYFQVDLGVNIHL